MIAGKIKKNGARDTDHALLGVVYHRRLGFDAVYLHAKFDGSSISWSRDINWWRQNFGRSRDHDNAPFKGDFYPFAGT